MSLLSLPNEILAEIAQECNHEDRSQKHCLSLHTTMQNMCAVNRRLRLTCRHVLYQSVVVCPDHKTLEAVKSFLLAHPDVPSFIRHMVLSECQDRILNYSFTYLTAVDLRRMCKAMLRLLPQLISFDISNVNPRMPLSESLLTHLNAHLSLQTFIVHEIDQLFTLSTAVDHTTRFNRLNCHHLYLSARPGARYPKERLEQLFAPTHGVRLNSLALCWDFSIADLDTIYFKGLLRLNLDLPDGPPSLPPATRSFLRRHSSLEYINFKFGYILLSALAALPIVHEISAHMKAEGLDEDALGLGGVALQRVNPCYRQATDCLDPRDWYMDRVELVLHADGARILPLFFEYCFDVESLDVDQRQQHKDVVTLAEFFNTIWWYRNRFGGLAEITLSGFPLWNIEDDYHCPVSDVLFDLREFNWRAHALDPDEENDIDHAWCTLVDRLKPYADSLCKVLEHISDGFPMLNGLEYHGRPGDTPGGEIFLEFTIERDADEMVVKDGTSYKVHVVKNV